MDPIINRILEQSGDRHLLEKLLSLPKSDLNTLLLKVFQVQAGNTAPADVIKAFHENRFSVPSEINPVDYHRLETELLTYAQRVDIKAILLSPSATFSSCSAFDGVDQNNVVSAVRGTEILADPTNMLAIIIADKFKNKESDHRQDIHYCTTARVLRAQMFSKTKRHFAHFGLFCVVSSGRDSGSYQCEKNLLSKQLSYYKKLLTEKYHAKLSVVLKKRNGYADSDGFFECMAEFFKKELPDTPVSFDLTHADNQYYKGVNFNLFMEKEGEVIEIGDGGFVDWIQKMTSNQKERCLISGLGLDRLLLP